MRTRDGQFINYAFDNLGRSTLTDVPSPEPDITYAYQNFGRAVSATSSGNTLSSSFDALGRVTSQTGPLGAITYQYDAAGRRTRMTWPDGFYVTYNYDLGDEMTAIRENGAASGVGVLAISAMIIWVDARRSRAATGLPRTMRTTRRRGSFLSLRIWPARPMM